MNSQELAEVCTNWQKVHGKEEADFQQKKFHHEMNMIRNQEQRKNIAFFALGFTFLLWAKKYIK
jgi:hypothetical protein